MIIQAFLKQATHDFERTLNSYIPKNSKATRLASAVKYTGFAPGKRLRPALVYATGKMLGANQNLLDDAACAVELIHTYSLIHDDLPAMDDDDLRRGRPACHKQFDEATAILAGDAMQALAFEVLANGQESIRLKMIHTLAKAAGQTGMVGGQSIDLDATGHFQELSDLQNMHALKTGALLQTSVVLGALSSLSIQDYELEQLKSFGANLGLAFQIQDDILDIEGSTEQLGKPAGSDQERGKSTYPSLMGLNGAKQAARDCYDQMMTALAGIAHDTKILSGLADLVIQRKF